MRSEEYDAHAAGRSMPAVAAGALQTCGLFARGQRFFLPDFGASRQRQGKHFSKNHFFLLL
ncbi:hypothetical protein [Pollutimonas bauzanensis]|uniref:hypothetical protein n=1 Tax=Pollutimonas bauzanensis TaxID=658167 RepID=UPI0011603A78|nr:hypothetical protein [Pollutimonas bauzanensis]